MRFYLPVLAALMPLLAIPSQAKSPDTNTLIYAPLAGIPQNQSLFESVLFREKIPETFAAYVGDARAGGSGMVGKVLLPLFTSSNEDPSKRLNGWAFGASTGYQRDALRANDIFVPGFYYFEGAVGRATSESWTVAGTGLRGYLEVAFRDQRPVKNPRQQNRLNLVSQIVPDDNYFLVLKIGASSDNQGSGIVTQSPGFFSWAVQSAVYIPLKSKQGYANIKVSPYRNCFGPDFRCGMHFYYMNLFRGIKKPNSEHANHFAMASLFLRYQKFESFMLDIETYQTLVTSPLVNRGHAVYSNRSSYSTYPGAKLTLVYGF